MLWKENRAPPRPPEPFPVWRARVDNLRKGTVMSPNGSHPSEGAAVDATARDATAATVKDQRLPVRIVRFCNHLPWFTYLLLVYVVGQLLVEDPRSILFDVGGYQLTWVEVLYLLATMAAMVELLKVSHPGINNTNDALLMMGAAMVYLVLFILGTASVVGFGVFNNTEFFMLLFISWVQVIMGFTINGRTLKRAIGYAAE